MVTSAWGLDFAHLTVWVGGDVLWQNHHHTDQCVPAWERTMPPSLLWVSLGCVTCGCHGDGSAKGRQSGSECPTCRCESSVVMRLTQSCSMMHSHRPLLLFVFPYTVHTLKLFCCCCANMLELMNMQAPTCQHTSLTGLIIDCYAAP